MTARRPATYAVYAIGCQQNWYDAEKIALWCDQLGMLPTDPSDAELIVVLSCSVRQKAMDRLYGFIGKWRKTAPKKRIVVTACILPDDTTVLSPIVDAIVPDQQIESWLQQEYGSLASTDAIPTATGTNITTTPGHAFVPITIGCNNFCTFCAVPHTRGREQSRPVADIVREITRLAQNGKPAITLLGQNVNSYGLSDFAPRDLRKNKDRSGRAWTPKNPSPFVALLQTIEKIESITSLSFLSPNPQDISSDLIDWMQHSRVFSKTLNLPLQSGSDTVLKRMNRRYSQAEYLALVDTLRQTVPDLIISTDIIVGFPGETDDDFAATLTVVKHAQFAKVFIGIYSPRPGTTAARLYPDDIPYTTKHQRYVILNDLINKQLTSLDARTAGRAA